VLPLPEIGFYFASGIYAALSGGGKVWLDANFTFLFRFQQQMIY
jgi:hypothetical protein